MKTIFLPGAGGSASFWKPVADLIKGPKTLLSWPGLGNEPSLASVNGFDDLVGLVLGELDGPANLVAQSMGGVIAVKAALAAPDNVKRLVLVATSGGVSMDGLRVADWRPEYREAFPDAAPWITDGVEDLSPLIPSIKIPVLLIWGDHDPISPLGVGKRLLSLLPNGRLEVVHEGEHDLALTYSEDVAKLVSAHFAD